MTLRALFSGVLLLLTGCDLSVLDHDPRAVFDDPQAYRASEDIVEIIRAKDAERFVDMAYTDGANPGDLRDQVEEFYTYLPDDDFTIELYYAELRQGDGEFEGIPVYLTGWDVIGRDSFA